MELVLRGPARHGAGTLSEPAAASAFLATPTLEARRGQAFPTLDAEEMERMRRFGKTLRYAAGEKLYETGKPSGGMHVIESGKVRILGRDVHGRELPVVEHGPGSFTGELGQLTRRRSFVDGAAVGSVETTFLDTDQMHAMLIAEAALGEKIMRALILRRVALMESGTGGPVIVGPADNANVVRLRNFLGRNGIPHMLLDPAVETDAREVIERYAPDGKGLPVVLCPDGSVLHDPSDNDVARCIGMLDRESADRIYDIAIVGAGPAGLATAVYAASEGLSVFVIDQRAFGGQAGASARIENYFGFPTGISGQALTGRAFSQAQKFGAQFLIPAEVVKLECESNEAKGFFTLHLAGERVIRSRTIIVASGARYRRAGLPALRDMEGRGVWFWASPVEARMCAKQEVALVGGGNSAGQAAVFLAGHAAKVWMLVRGEGLAATMSKYLIDRIANSPRIELRTRTEITAVDAPHDAIEAVTFRNRSGEETTRPIRNVFLFLGADPCTDWLSGCGVAVDAKGFVTTGGESRDSLETSVPGVFAIGDVRAGSVKRVGAAIGEGASVVAQIHAYFARQVASAHASPIT
ncbi:MAG TPA: FAD-dependent oxidoreductase [Usitatibacter sp.]|nr:FAD-dependent oxidoreductase [Usitatibacter sp.]